MAKEVEIRFSASGRCAGCGELLIVDALHLGQCPIAPGVKMRAKVGQFECSCPAAVGEVHMPACESQFRSTAPAMCALCGITVGHRGHQCAAPPRYGRAQRLNDIQASATAAVDEMRAELERVTRERDALLSHCASSEKGAEKIYKDARAALDHATRFIAGLNLQDHPRAIVQEQRAMVMRLNGLLKPACSNSDAKAVVAQGAFAAAEYSRGAAEAHQWLWKGAK